MKEKNKDNSGISLVALIVTVIVILIIAGISISFVFGENNGIINKAVNSRNVHNRAGIQEKIDIAVYSLKFDKSDIDAQKVKNELIASNLYSDEDIEVLSENKIKIDGEEFEISVSNNNSSNPTQPVPTLQDNINTAIADIEGEVTTETIIDYLIEHDIYDENEIETEPKDDLTDTIKIGNQEVDVPTNRYVLYFEKPIELTTENNVYAYIWYKNSNNVDTPYTSWPGIQIYPQSDGSNVYKYQLPESPEGYNWEKIIFNLGNGKPQTADLELGNKGQVFKTSVYSNVVFSNRVGHFSDPLYVYAWKDGESGTINNHAWPGLPMTAINNDKTIYKYDMGDNNWEYFIINDNNLQTFDMEYEKGNRIYCVNGGSDFANDSNNKSKLKESYRECLYGEWGNKE